MKIIDLSADVVLVTGAAGSIGGAIARELAVAGARVIVADIHAEACADVAAEIRDAGGAAFPAAVDVRDTGSVDRGIRAGVSELGPLTGLVNVAAVLRTGRLDEMPEESWDEIMDINVGGTYRSTKAVLPFFRQSGRGSIVNLASVAAFGGSDDGSAYSATKGAVLSFTYSTAGELAPEGFRVNAICPGWVDGGFTAQAMSALEHPEALAETARRMHYLGRMATPGDVANAAVWLLSDQASFVTGTALFVDGGYMIKR